MGSTVFPAAGGGVRQYAQEFTSTGNWTAPSGCNAVEVFMVGGGGGAGAYTCPFTGAHGGGGGGGGGEVLKTVLTVTPGTTYTITIGSGGAGATANGAAGAVGNDTTFGALATAQGGGGGWGVNQTASVFNAGTDRATQGSFPLDNQISTHYGSSAGGAGGSGEIIGNGGTSNTNGRTFVYSSNIVTQPKISGFRSNALTQVTEFQIFQTIGGKGVDGFGGGATSPALQMTSIGSTIVGSANSSDGAAPSVVRDSSSGGTNGQNAVANRGGGGSGGGSGNSTVGTFTGGNGGSGYAKLVWWA